MVLAPTVGRWSGALLVLLSQVAACFNPGSDDPLSTGAMPDPTTGSTSTAPSDGSTTEPDPGDATTEAPTTGTMTTDEPADSTTSGPECGNGVLEDGEECDDGPANGDTAACRSDCTVAVCGDGSVWEDTEECDAAGESEACDADCTLPACGDGVANALAGEECDDGNGDDTDECPSTCLAATCGDGHVWQGMEECDTDVGTATCADFGLQGDLACNAECGLDATGCYVDCPGGGAFVGNMCWYLSGGCDGTDVTCAAQGLLGVDGYVPVAWDMATMQAIADHYGWVNGGDISCCVEFGWVQDGALYTHNFGPQFYNWPGCYDVYSTIKACSPP